MENLCKGKGIKLINNNNIDGSCLNRSKLHLNKSWTALLVKDFSQANWLCSFNDSVTDEKQTLIPPIIPAMFHF